MKRAVALATVMLCACGQDPRASEPQASSVIRTFVIAGPSAGDTSVQITEFRDSAGRTCVLARTGSVHPSLALSCGYPVGFPEPVPER